MTLNLVEAVFSLSRLLAESNLASNESAGQEWTSLFYLSGLLRRRALPLLLIEFQLAPRPALLNQIIASATKAKSGSFATLLSFAFCYAFWPE